MFGFLKKKTSSREARPLIADWSFLKTDIHSHLLPGIDDGAETMEQSLDLLAGLQQAGFSKVVTTPHISQDYYPNKEDAILSALEAWKAAITEAGLEIEVHAAAEYMIDEAFMERLALNTPLLTLDGKHVLFEMGFVQESPHLMQVIFELQAKGYIPVLAHPERYNYYIETNAITELERLQQAGCLLQLNTISLSGYYGKHVKKFAESILEKRLYDFAGTDIHHDRHHKALQAVLSVPAVLNLCKYPFRNSAV